MPHSEYPSGSSCICTAYANGKTLYYGSDNLIFPLFRSIDAFSSIYEPLTTPSKNLTFLYFTWSDIAKRCGETRVESGVHFTESVPAGEQLCQDIGVEVTTQLINLKNGIVPDYIIDFEDRDIIQMKMNVHYQNNVKIYHVRKMKLAIVKHMIVILDVKNVKMVFIYLVMIILVLIAQCHVETVKNVKILKDVQNVNQIVNLI